MNKISKVYPRTEHTRHKYHSFLKSYSRVDIAKHLGISRIYLNAIMGGCRQSRELDVKIEEMVKDLRTQEAEAEEGCKADA